MAYCKPLRMMTRTSNNRCRKIAYAKDSGKISAPRLDTKVAVGDSQNCDNTEFVSNAADSITLGR